MNKTLQPGTPRVPSGANRTPGRLVNNSMINPAQSSASMSFQANPQTPRFQGQNQTPQFMSNVQGMRTPAANTPRQNFTPHIAGVPQRGITPALNVPRQTFTPQTSVNSQRMTSASLNPPRQNFTPQKSGFTQNVTTPSLNNSRQNFTPQFSGNVQRMRTTGQNVPRQSFTPTVSSASHDARVATPRMQHLTPNTNTQCGSTVRSSNSMTSCANTSRFSDLNSRSGDQALQPGPLRLNGTDPIPQSRQTQPLKNPRQSKQLDVAVSNSSGEYFRVETESPCMTSVDDGVSGCGNEIGTRNIAGIQTAKECPVINDSMCSSVTSTPNRKGFRFKSFNKSPELDTESAKNQAIDNMDAMRHNINTNSTLNQSTNNDKCAGNRSATCVSSAISNQNSALNNSTRKSFSLGIGNASSTLTSANTSVPSASNSRVSENTAQSSVKLSVPSAPKTSTGGTAPKFLKTTGAKPCFQVDSEWNDGMFILCLK